MTITESLCSCNASSASSNAPRDSLRRSSPPLVFMFLHPVQKSHCLGRAPAGPAEEGRGRLAWCRQRKAVNRLDPVENHVILADREQDVGAVFAFCRPQADRGCELPRVVDMYQRKPCRGVRCPLMGCQRTCHGILHTGDILQTVNQMRNAPRFQVAIDSIVALEAVIFGPADEKRSPKYYLDRTTRRARLGRLLQGIRLPDRRRPLTYLKAL